MAWPIKGGKSVTCIKLFLVIGLTITQEKFDISHWCPLLLVRPLPKKSLIQVTDVPPFIGLTITQEKFDISHWCPLLLVRPLPKKSLIQVTDDPPFIGQAITQEKFDTSHWCPLLLFRPLPKKSLIQVTDVLFYCSDHYQRKVWYKSLVSPFIGQSITQEKFDISHWCPLLLVRPLPKKRLMQVTDVSPFIDQTITQEKFDTSHWCPLLLFRPLPKKSLIQVTDVLFYCSDHYPRKVRYKSLVSPFIVWVMVWPIKEDISDLYQTFLG
jgi:hypothetical protein